MRPHNTASLLLLAWLAHVSAFVELPKFNQMKLMYPGYYLHDGKVRDRQLLDLIGGNYTEVIRNLHNTSPLRMSYTLNMYNGRHALGTSPVLLSKKGRDSVTGKDGMEYIFRNTAFGPFLAAKYGNPVVAKPDKHDHTQTMAPFHGKQGIVRLVSYHRTYAGGHIALWDCDHFHQSSDWTSEHHLISVEFWEAPDSYCAKKVSTPLPHLVTMAPDDLVNLHILPRHNVPLPEHLHYRNRDDAGPQVHLRHQRMHRKSRRQQQKETLWLQ